MSAAVPSPTSIQSPQGESSHRQPSSRRNHRHNNNNNPRKRPRRREPKTEPLICSVCADDEKPASYKCPKCRALYCSVACCKQHKELCGINARRPDQDDQEKKKNGQANAATKPSRYGQAGSTNETIFPWQQRQQVVVLGDDVSDSDESLDEGWKITDEMRQSLKRSSWLHKELQDGGLQSLIRDLVANHRRNNQSDRAPQWDDQTMLNQVQERFPHFHVFLDKLLVVAGVLERQKEDSGDGTEVGLEPLADWLGRDWSGTSNGNADPFFTPPNLCLKPIMRTPLPVFEPVEASSSSEEEEEDTSSSSAEDDSSDDSSSGSD